jgi:hypothetical protein
MRIKHTAKNVRNPVYIEKKGEGYVKCDAVIDGCRKTITVDEVSYGLIIREGYYYEEK